VAFCGQPVSTFRAPSADTFGTTDAYGRDESLFNSNRTQSSSRRLRRRIQYGTATLEDEAYAVARFDNGQWLTLHFSSIDAKGKDKWVEITGTLGSYAFDGSTWEWRSVDAQGTTIKQGKNRESNAGLCYYQNLVDHLVNGAELIITPEWSRRPIQILDLAVRSAREGRSLMA
jgi:predicted dehydrogenase